MPELPARQKSPSTGALGDQAKAKHNPELTPDHLLVALTDQEGTVVVPVLAKLGRPAHRKLA